MLNLCLSEQVAEIVYSMSLSVWTLRSNESAIHTSASLAVSGSFTETLFRLLRYNDTRTCRLI